MPKRKLSAQLQLERMTGRAEAEKRYRVDINDRLAVSFLPLTQDLFQGRTTTESFSRCGDHAPKRWPQTRTGRAYGLQLHPSGHLSFRYQSAWARESIPIAGRRSRKSEIWNCKGALSAANENSSLQVENPQLSPSYSRAYPAPLRSN